MKFTQIIVGLTILASLGVSPIVTSAQTISTDETNRAVLLERIQTLLAQIAVLQAQLDEQKRVEAAEAVTVVRPNETFNGAAILERYIVSGEKSTDDISNYQHRKYLERVYEIFPDEYEALLGEFAVFRDKGGDFGAFVETIPPTHEMWSLAVNSDILRNPNSDANTELIVHELAHLISYEEMLGVALPGTASCRSYFKNRGCPKNNSYITAFADTFWSDADLERAKEFRADRSPIDAADDYFEETEADDRYVSSYAALSPEEDFAESFAIYVVDRVVQRDTVVSKKVWWFDQFTELREIRSYIR